MTRLRTGGNGGNHQMQVEDQRPLEIRIPTARSVQVLNVNCPFGIMSINYLLHESSVGYALFQVVHQPDTVGNRMKEFQASVQVGSE